MKSNPCPFCDYFQIHLLIHFQEDIFESRVYPHEVDLKGRVTDQAAALIMELARNRQLYSTWVILCCWNLDTTLWVVSEARVKLIFNVYDILMIELDEFMWSKDCKSYHNIWNQPKNYLFYLYWYISFRS